MARRPGSRCRWLLRGSEAVVLGSALLVQPVAASEDTTTGETANIIDRAQLRSAVALEQPGMQFLQDSRGVALILAVEVNGMDHGLAQFRLIDDQLWATRQVIGELGLKTAADGTPADLLALADALDAAVTYNAALQSVSVMVETSRLAVGTSRLNTNDQSRPVPSSATGALLNYDLNANFIGDDVSIDGFTETRLFSGNALAENTALFHVGGGPGRRSFLRLDTTVSLSLPEQGLTIRAGDIITRGTSWSRATRLGGVRIGTDFALQPYLVTAPIPAFFGDAALPSTVDLYIDGLKRFSGAVAPGPFEVGSGANRINGAGLAQLVVTDALGQVNTFDFPIYDTPALLREGLTDWSIELGAVRQSYGLRSFDYASDPVASTSLRTGLSNYLTLEAHAEAGAGLVNGGAGAAWLMPFGGVLAGSVAASDHRGESGARVELGYSWTDSRFNLSATAQRASRDYRDLAAVHDARVPRERDVVTVGHNSGRLGSFGVSLVRQRHTAQPTTSFASMNWYRSLGPRFSLSLSAHQDLQRTRERGAFLSLSFVPGSGDHVSAGLQANERRTSASFGYRRSLPYEGGTGWAADATFDGDRLQTAGQVDHLASVGQATVGGRMIGGQASAYAGYSGALVVMEEGLFASRKVFDGFAVVSTSGVADVPVRVHNREIGRTNDRGHLLVTGLNAWQNNRVTIDTSDLPPTLWVERIESQAVPADRSGAVVDFAITPIRSVLVSLVDEAEAELPVGMAGLMDDDASQPLMVGFGGQLFIERAEPGALVVLQSDSGTCTFRLPDELPSDNAGRLGKTTCEVL
ncbi:fimbria/pilus outer membrane usher protein [Altererythrobacter sp. KTW20L]|uniref:fimbria/pilus outer membrane usher protein n=1 Tax=Altererythrobacter sp. KTW20L TaxID=2942210 RepID=UPI0020BDC21A|nr:fimbria/pilus outer membrane usher protein [Altererythrobacter sp. KTW20L]MCL6252125.1 fimbria/pilus outer membrane usher protein [Altererythrobacter sp. KTW20L]